LLRILFLRFSEVSAYPAAQMLRIGVAYVFPFRVLIVAAPEQHDPRATGRVHWLIPHDYAFFVLRFY
jgi:hypothetical protein